MKQNQPHLNQASDCRGLRSLVKPRHPNPPLNRGGNRECIKQGALSISHPPYHRGGWEGVAIPKANSESPTRISYGLLCLFCITECVGLLYAMQNLDWENIDVHNLVNAFNQNPLGSESSWLTWLVVTNFIPLLLHYLAVVWGIWHRHWSPPHIHRYVQSIQQKQPLTKTDARIFAMFLT